MLISLSLFNLNALADEVDPIGADPGFKSIQFQAIILDKIKYPTYLAEGQIDEASFMFSSSQYDGRLHFEKLKPETTPTTLVSDVYTVYETYDGSFSIFYDDIILSSGELKKGSKIVTCAFKRIDVNHMTVTRDDGSTYIAKGKVAVTMYDKNDNWVKYLVSSMPTQSGIFVPVGYKYHIKVVADTNDDRDTYERNLDYTNL